MANIVNVIKFIISVLAVRRGDVMTLTKIISGGQTGADQGALSAGLILVLETGGWAPRGWRTEVGPQKTLLKSYGLRQHRASSYPPRTRANIEESDGTLIFGNPSSPGSTLTAILARKYGKPVFGAVWPFDQDEKNLQRAFQRWIDSNWIRPLNVAGNRESKNPGIQEATKLFLIKTLGEIDDG